VRSPFICDELFGEGGAVGAGTVDDDQRRRVLGVASDPADGTAQAGRAGRELRLLPDRAGVGDDQAEGVGGGVGVHADDEVVLVCDHGHCGVLPSRGDVVTASAQERCSRGRTVMSHDPLRRVGQASDQATERGQGRRPTSDRMGRSH
jgi:hypothetical protein